jgi:hypothetical protein
MLLSLVLLAQMTTYPTAAQNSKPAEVQPPKPAPTKSLPEIAGARMSGLSWPTEVPTAPATPEPLPTYEPVPAFGPVSTPVPTLAAFGTTASVAPGEESHRFRTAAVIALLALVAAAALVVARRSGKKSTPAPPLPPRRQARPAAQPPAVPAEVVSARPARPEFDWQWGARVGPAEELEVVGPTFRHRFFKHWEDWHPGEMEAAGAASRPAVLDDLVARVVENGAHSGSFDAWLKPVTDDPYNPGAVEVVAVVRPDLIEKVASLSPVDAGRWHARLLELERRTGHGLLAHGRVLKAPGPGLPHAILVLADIKTLEEIRAALDALPEPKAGRKRIRRLDDLDL